MGSFINVTKYRKTLNNAFKDGKSAGFGKKKHRVGSLTRASNIY